MVLITKKNGGGGGSSGGTVELPYTLIDNNQSIDVGNVYGIDTTNGEITLTLNNGTTQGQILTVKKIDSSDNSVFINNANIDGETSIEISMEGESYDLYWTGTTFIIK